MRSVIRDLETREKGVDICIMMDGTGSMVGTSMLACHMVHAMHAYNMNGQSVWSMLASTPIQRYIGSETLSHIKFTDKMHGLQGTASLTQSKYIWNDAHLLLSTHLEYPQWCTLYKVSWCILLL